MTITAGIIIFLIALAAIVADVDVWFSQFENSIESEIPHESPISPGK